MMELGVALIETEGLVIGYPSSKGSRAVAGPLDLTVYGGKLICLLGPNGSGKSTLLRTLAGLQPASAGRILLDGLPLKTLKAPVIARKLSLVLSEKVTGSNLDVYSLIALGRYPYSGWFGKLNAEDRAMIVGAAELTDTTRFLDRKLDSLSDGECQKVMLARAIAQDTPVVVLDEPTAHLDLPSRLKLMQLLYNLAHETGKAIIVSTHELDLALQASDLIWLMDGRGALYSGLPEQLVLDGVFEKAFNREEINFDPYTGHFTIPRVLKQQVSLNGDGLALIWTKKALERCGYWVTDSFNSEFHVSIEVWNGGLRWTVSISGQPDQYFKDLQQLMDTLV
ncbi:ABC transporter ATP-binding protein [Pedobacter antarcticus]|uniref:ABC transporter ATP-binding protein n=1 Tax=Pedobacter antarcticus TaxID=34086 RepID=UPI0029308675|nr:ABC transporter ATP-binding protein [Pedobacter antarcticus]